MNVPSARHELPTLSQLNFRIMYFGSCHILPNRESFSQQLRPGQQKSYHSNFFLMWELTTIVMSAHEETIDNGVDFNVDSKIIWVWMLLCRRRGAFSKLLWLNWLRLPKDVCLQMLNGHVFWNWNVADSNLTLWLFRWKMLIRRLMNFCYFDWRCYWPEGWLVKLTFEPLDFCKHRFRDAPSFLCYSNP